MTGFFQIRMFFCLHRWYFLGVCEKFLGGPFDKLSVAQRSGAVVTKTAECPRAENNETSPI